MAVSVKPSSISRAIAKATKARMYATIEQVTPTEWMVRGESDWYVVWRNPDGTHGCSCRAAAQFGLPVCAHRAAQWLAQARDNMVAGTSRAN